MLVSGRPMRKHRIAITTVMVVALWLALVAIVHTGENPGLDPSAFRDASTIQIMTTEPEVGEHWSKLWVVVIDGQPYVRLGDRSYGRIQKNSTSPYVKLKVA